MLSPLESALTKMWGRGECPSDPLPPATEESRLSTVLSAACAHLPSQQGGTPHPHSIAHQIALISRCVFRFRNTAAVYFVSAERTRRTSSQRTCLRPSAHLRLSLPQVSSDPFRPPAHPAPTSGNMRGLIARHTTESLGTHDAQNAFND